MNLIFLIFWTYLLKKVLNAPTDSNRRAPTLLISLDGLRASSLDQFLEENPHSFIKNEFVDVGIKANYMKPSFTTLTFPNHYTIVTGLYIESHGIIGNSLYDPNTDEKVNFLGGVKSLDTKWWNSAEPIWLTAKNQGLKTASFFWPGSQVWTRHPDFFLTYTDSYSFKERCEEVVNWFKKFDMDFATLYFNEPDHTGHSYGANSKEYMEAIREVDWIIGYLIELLNQAELGNKLNIIIVSDHGMADMKNETIFVYDYVDKNLIDSNRTIFGVVSNIYPIDNDVSKTKVYEALSKIPNLRVFYKENIPKELHFQNSKRIAPIVAIADEGYVMNTFKQTLKGNHGFDNEIEAMRAVFLARGPDFKSNVKINNLKNVDVYPLLCELMKIDCNPNNGSMIPFENALNLKSNSSRINPFIIKYFIVILFYFFL